MKRFFSILLTIAMLLTSFAFAAPAPVAVENAVETMDAAELAQEEAELTALTKTDYGYVLNDWSWDAQGIASNIIKNGTIVEEDGEQAVRIALAADAQGTATDRKATLTLKSDGSSVEVIPSWDPYYGYNLLTAANHVSKIVIRAKFTTPYVERSEGNSHIENSVKVYFSLNSNSAWSVSEATADSEVLVDGEFRDYVLDYTKIANYQNGKPKALGGIRIDPIGGLYPGESVDISSIAIYSDTDFTQEPTLIKGLDFEFDGAVDWFGEATATSGTGNKFKWEVVSDNGTSAFKIVANGASAQSGVTWTETTTAPNGVKDYNWSVPVNIPADLITKVVVRAKMYSPYPERQTKMLGESNENGKFEFYWATDVNDGAYKGAQQTAAQGLVADNEYHDVTFNFASNRQIWGGNITQFRIDPTEYLFEGEEIYIDSIKFYTSSDFETITATFPDAVDSELTLPYTQRIINAKLDKDTSITSFANGYARSDSYTVHSYDSATDVMQLVAQGPSIQNSRNNGVWTQKAFCFYDYIAKEMICFPALKITYNSNTADMNGENLFINGDFSQNIRMTAYKNADGSNVIKTENGNLILGYSDANSTVTDSRFMSWDIGNYYFNLARPTEGTKPYYVEFRSRPTAQAVAAMKALKDAGFYKNGAAANPQMFATVYAPKLDGKNGSDTTSSDCHFTYPDYIPTTKNKSSMNAYFNYGSNTDWEVKAGVYNVRPDANGFYIQMGFQNGPYYTDAASTTAAIWKEITFEYDYFIVKEMYNINFSAGDGQGEDPETMLYAKDVEFVVPDNPYTVTDGKGFCGWYCDETGETYIPGDTVSLDYAGDVTFMATFDYGFKFMYDNVTTEAIAADYNSGYVLPKTFTEEGITLPENYIVESYTYGTETYYPGDIFYDYELEGKILTVNAIDITRPAMHWCFEGDAVMTSDNLGSNKVKENRVLDDGTTVFHYSWDHYKGATKRADVNKGNDSRESRVTTTGITPKAEFNVFKLRFRAYDLMTAKDVKDDATGEVTGITYQPQVYTDISSNQASATNFAIYFNQLKTENDTLKPKYYFESSSDFRTVEYDLSQHANYGTGAKEFYFNLANANKGTVDFDYARLYRGGVHSVVYNTNAPEGANEVTAVAADTGVGFGSGYALSGDKPVLDTDAYTFVGWSTNPDATVDEAVNYIVFDEHVKNVYAVWADNTAPTNVGQELRADTATNGIRYMGTVTADQRAEAVEYGYIVARTTKLAENSEELTFNSITKYVYGAAYITEENRDNVWAWDGDNAVFTGVLTGFASVEQYSESLTVRPYLAFEASGKKLYVYGEAIVGSMQDIVNQMLENGAEAEWTDEQTAYASEILGM